MRSMSLLAACVVVCCLYFACNKPDFPPNGKLCQLMKIESRYVDSSYGRSFAYRYNADHSLDSIIGSLFNVNIPVLYGRATYDAQGRPSAVNIGTWYTTFNYQQSKLSVIDLGQPWFFYKYDYKGRITQRNSPIDTVWYQYSDGSRNYTKRIYKGAQAGPEYISVNTYKYDNKVNPVSNWPNLTVNPFAYDLNDPVERMFEPMPDANWTYQSYYINGRTEWEVFYTYTYDNVYPLRAKVKEVFHPLGKADYVLQWNTSYTYECAPKGAIYYK